MRTPERPRLVAASPPTTTGALRVIVVDDQDLVRAGLRMILQAEPDITVVGEAGDGQAAVEIVAALDPDVVLMDVRMPRMSGLEATRRLTELGSRARVLVLTTFDLDEWQHAPREQPRTHDLGITPQVAARPAPAATQVPRPRRPVTTSRSHTVLPTAALAYTGASVFSSYVALRDNVPGEPFGISAPFTMRTALVVGWGAGIAPPWFMPAAALLAAHRANAGHPGPALVASAIGIASIAGHLIEPVTHRPGSWTPATAAAITLTLTASTVLAAAGYARYASNKATTHRTHPR